MNLKLNSHGLIPAIAQCAVTGRVLMMAWMNQEAFDLTQSTGQAHYYSRSRKCLWRKGETSGNTQAVAEVRLDCDADTVLLLIKQTGPACHTNEPSCFFKSVTDAEVLGPPPAGVIEQLAAVIHERSVQGGTSSYTSRLLSGGMDDIVAKVAEESTELIEALNNETDERVVSEAADLLYHVMVGFESRGVDVRDVAFELARRFGVSGLVEKAQRETTS